ncbi:hypothetical protein BG011_006876 [Mortierella polycephala]|uniref:Uncharacterized protein n=1 Tax=Mortierella polycephala TaxID=41804 RepID=A0A9P6PUX2_9FUNG|nr:hypothetical protein BG011_006876 [Mortierella polycephala]
MRFSAIAIISAVVAVASAQTEGYPFTPNGECVAACLVKAGTGLFPNFSSDPNSPYFIESLSYAHDRGTPKYTAFMTASGMCIGGCPKEEQDHYLADNEAKSDWYAANKDTYQSGSGDSPAPTPESAASSAVVAKGLVGAAALMGAIALF